MDHRFCIARSTEQVPRRERLKGFSASGGSGQMARDEVLRENSLRNWVKLMPTCGRGDAECGPL
jgi:hypothetical protein